MVAQAAGDRRATRKILLDKRTHHVALETLLVINNVIRDTNGLGHAPRVIYVVKRAATALHRFGHTLMTSQSALIPKLHGQAYDIVALRAQHGRNGRRVNSSRHSDGDGS